MSNKRKEIRKAFIELLKGKTRALFSVYAEDRRMHWEEELPAITVWVGSEESEMAGEAPFRYRRTVQVEVRVVDRQVHDPLDQLDDFMAEVERLVDGEDLFSLSESVDRIEYTGSEPDIDGETTKIGASAVIHYRVSYFTYAGADPDDTEPLEGIHADWDDTAFTQDQIDLAQT